MSEYDLKKSEKIGQLYPVLVDAKGNVVDGFHRLEADPNWKTETLEEIDTEEKLLIARAVANWNRRQVPREEKIEWINGLAEIYKKQGLEVRKEVKTDVGGYRINEIVKKIAEVTGLDESTVRDYISPAYKQMETGHKEQKPRVLASQVIQKAFPDEYGQQLVKRHRKEIELEIRPTIEREIRERVEEEIKPKIKEELSQDTEFIIETIKKAPDVLPKIPERKIKHAKRIAQSLTKEMGVKEGTIYTVGEYECSYCKKHYLIKCNGKRDWIE